MARISFDAGLRDTDTPQPGTYDYSNDHDQIEKLQANTAWLFGQSDERNRAASKRKMVCSWNLLSESGGSRRL